MSDTSRALFPGVVGDVELQPVKKGAQLHVRHVRQFVGQHREPVQQRGNVGQARWFPQYFRVVRNQSLSVREESFVEAARALGASLSPRENEVLALMAEGRSNAAIADVLVVGRGAVEKHVANIFLKLGLEMAESDNRRVLAVLRYLDS